MDYVMIYNPQKYAIPDEPMKPFIDIGEIENILKNTESNNKELVREVIAKSLAKNRLSMEETAILINTSSPELINEIKQGAKKLKEKIYGERIVLFAPLYIGNKCQNNCSYCGFKASNKDIIRKTIAGEELVMNVKALEDAGHKRLILVYGEHKDYSPQFIADSVREVYKVKQGTGGEIRRVNINAAPLEIEGFKTVLDAGIGTYQIFQETYHQESYKTYHVSGKKRDYNYRLTALDRAFEAGIDDVGIGVLFGLHDWKFEVLSLIRHVNHFEAVYNCGPHTISFPRITTFSDSNIELPNKVSDDDFTKLVAILRLAVPYTGMILTAREPVEIRQEVMSFGVSQIDGGTNIELGGYSEILNDLETSNNNNDQGDKDIDSINKKFLTVSEPKHEQDVNREQFTINDDRPLSEVIKELLENGYIPSFCTACYRKGRTGEHFMEFAVPGFVKNLCTPNAMLTLTEYLEDYADDYVYKIGYDLIEKKLSEFQSEKTAAETKRRIEKIKQGERDLYF